MPDIRYLPKKISELNLKTDSRVSILGRVAELGDNSFILDDGDRIEISSDVAVEPNKFVRAFCSVIDEKLKADFVQKLNSFDSELFYKVKELYSKSGV